jgi:hypothetical protein
MPGNGANTVQDSRAIEHELWLAMQAAHSRYENSSAALAALTAMSPCDGGLSDRNLHIEATAADQRTAFENYVEARLQLTEFLLSRLTTEPRETVIPEDADNSSRSAPRSPKWVTLAVVAGFLLPTVFGLGYLAHARSQSRALEVTRGEANAALNRTRNQVEALFGQVEALKAANQKLARSANRAAPLSHTNRVIPGHAAAPSLAPKGGRIARNHQELVQLQKKGTRSYREFTLTTMKYTGRIGPISLTALKVDPARKFSDLSITVDHLRPNTKRVNLYEPVWIDLSGRPKAVELVVYQINRDRVQGYLSEPKYQPWSLGRASPEPSVVALPGVAY